LNGSQLQPNLAFEKFSKSLKSISAGSRFELKPSGGLPPTFAFESVSGAKVQMIWTQSAYFSSKEYAFTLLSYPPFIESERYLQWRRAPDTIRLVDGLYSKYGLKSIPCSVIDSNMDFVLRQTPDGDYQYRGARIAVVGPLQEIYSANGIVPIAIPLGETVRSMQTGTIDGAYAYSPYDSIELRFYEATKALVFPSKVRSFFVIDLLINLEFWTALPESDQRAIEGVCKSLVTETLSSSKKLANDAAEKYRSAGVPVITLPESDTAQMRLKWEEIAAKRSLFEPVFGQLFKSLYAK
jgi:TRAP-type mannitol/chloroaromatic compound transport system substrate-binding protein